MLKSNGVLMPTEFSTFSNNSRSVLILLNNNFEHKLERVQTCQNGNNIILDIKIHGGAGGGGGGSGGGEDNTCYLYGQNDDKPVFQQYSRKLYGIR